MDEKKKTIQFNEVSDFQTMAMAISQFEGKKEATNIAQINEVLSIALTIMANMPEDARNELLAKYVGKRLDYDE